MHAFKTPAWSTKKMHPSTVDVPGPTRPRQHHSKEFYLSYDVLAALGPRSDKLVRHSASECADLACARHEEHTTDTCFETVATRVTSAVSEDQDRMRSRAGSNRPWSTSYQPGPQDCQGVDLRLSQVKDPGTVTEKLRSERARRPVRPRIWHRQNEVSQARTEAHAYPLARIQECGQENPQASTPFLACWQPDSLHACIGRVKHDEPRCQFRRQERLAT